MLDIFLIFFLNFISLLSLIVYLLRFNTNSKRHFLKYMLRRVSISTSPSINRSMFTEEDVTTITNEYRKEF